MLLPLLLLAAGCAHTLAPTENSTTSPPTAPPSTPASITVSVSPTSATVPSSGGFVLTGTVSGAGGSSSNVTWSVDGVVGGNSSAGTIVSTASANGEDVALYTAPPAPPPSTVTITATSVADPSKSASAAITIVCGTTNSISPAAASVALNQTQGFTAMFCGTNGGAIAWDVNGIANGNSTVGSIAVNSANTAVYTAPADLPTPNTVTIHATASPASSAAATVSATVILVSSVDIAISPSSAEVAIGQRVTFTPTISNTSDTGVAWFVNGDANGNAAVGQICQTGSNPCAPPNVPATGSVDYLAPASDPTSNPIAITAVSHADPSRSASAVVTVFAPNNAISVSVSPP